MRGWKKHICGPGAQGAPGVQEGGETGEDGREPRQGHVGHPECGVYPKSNGRALDAGTVGWHEQTRQTRGS